MNKKRVYYWSRSVEGKIVYPELTKNHFGKSSRLGILLGDDSYKNPWIQGNSAKYFTYIDFDKIYDFEIDRLNLVQNTYREVQRSGGRLMPVLETLLINEGWEGYSRHGEIKYFYPVSIHRDYEIQPTKDAEKFHSSISSARKRHEESGTDKHLTISSLEELTKMRLFLSKYEEAGFALDGDNIVSVFSDPLLTPNAFPNLMDVAVRNGGRRVDIFDTYLPKLYLRAGFREVARMLWDDKFAPKGWNHEAFKQYNGGYPDVVFMVYDPASKPPYVSGYEEAEKIQNQELEKSVV